MINLTTSVHKLMEIQEKEILDFQNNNPNFTDNCSSIYLITKYIMLLPTKKEKRQFLNSSLILLNSYAKYKKNKSYDNYVFVKFEPYGIYEQNTNGSSRRIANINLHPVFAKVE